MKAGNKRKNEEEQGGGYVQYESNREPGKMQTAPAEAGWGREVVESISMSGPDKKRLDEARAAHKRRRAGY